VGPTALGQEGIIVESVPNLTLSGIEELGSWVSQGSEGASERFGWPYVVAIEGDVLPPERRDLRSSSEMIPPFDRSWSTAWPR
jgi:hypothetical protein